MTAQDVIRDAGLILAAGLIAAPVAALLRVPIMIILLGFGIALGPTGVGLIENPWTGWGRSSSSRSASLKLLRLRA